MWRKTYLVAAQSTSRDSISHAPSTVTDDLCRHSDATSPSGSGSVQVLSAGLGCRAHAGAHTREGNQADGSGCEEGGEPGQMHLRKTELGLGAQVASSPIVL